MDIMDRHYEFLAKLYMRLKGYVVSNLIIHSHQPGNSKSELDIIAVRMPFHSQEYRWVNVEDYLESPNDRIEILIGDVKNKTKLDAIEFNEGLRKDQESIKQLIDWVGIYSNVSQKEIEKFEYFLNLHRIKDCDGFLTFDEDLAIGKFRLKFTFFCPQLSKWSGKGFKYIHGEELIGFCWECLNETQRIKTCSRRYNFGGWNELTKYVLFFKDTKEKVTTKGFETYCKKLF
jgi:hypothetical protein